MTGRGVEVGGVGAVKHGDGVIVGAVGVLAAPHLWDFDGEVIHGGVGAMLRTPEMEAAAMYRLGWRSASFMAPYPPMDRPAT